MSLDLLNIAEALIKTIITILSLAVGVVLLEWILVLIRANPIVCCKCEDKDKSAPVTIDGKFYCIDCAKSKRNPWYGGDG